VELPGVPRVSWTLDRWAVYLAIERAETKWKAYNGTNALRGLKTHFGDRFPD
jgi:hypothetical protein